MPRLARIDIPGLLQHVMVRGIEKRDIFLDDVDRRSFVERLSRLLLKTETECLAWALMSNHFHLLLRSTKTNLSTLMRRLLTGYAVVFNLRHHRTGHLFQNRYKSIVCDQDSYLLELVRYIHLNPLRVGLVSSVAELDEYEWCGHRCIMEHGGLVGQAIDEVLAMFAGDRAAARAVYRQFVQEGIAMGRRDELVGGGLKRYLLLSGAHGCQAWDERVLGSGDFVEQLWQQAERPEEPCKQLPLDDLIREVAAIFEIEVSALTNGSRSRQVAAARGAVCFIASKKRGINGAEIGKVLKITRSGVAKDSRRGEDLCSGNEKLKSLYE
ncbi:MAG TPA: transposase [Geobacter sp.]|nr:transposase [Geobacter sp.]